MATTYKQAEKTANVPNGEFARRFEKSDILDENGTNWANTNLVSPWTSTHTRGDAAQFPTFNFNQMSMKEFFDLTTSKSTTNMYKGMLERIGRTVIWADDLADNPFLRFMMSPLEYGSAIENAYFEDIQSRTWVKNYQSSGSDKRNPLFDTKIPEYKNDVAIVNFSREIPLKMSEIEYRKACQTANMIGDVAGALMSKLNVTFIDDMYEACKQYFCGALRICPEIQGTMPYKDTELENNKMISVIDLSTSTCPEDLILDELHKITDSEFFYKSRDYNLTGKYTLSKKMTLIMPRKWRYPTFMKKFATTYHPEYIKLGEEVDPLYINEMPQMLRSTYPTGWELFGILVDNRALAITPLNGGFSVGSFVNPSEGSTSYFGHYEFIFSFLPFFNRKYIFVKNNSSNKEAPA